MNRNQWFTWSIASFLAGVFLFAMNRILENSCAQATLANLSACMKAELTAPLSYVFLGLGIVFLFCAEFEHKR